MGRRNSDRLRFEDWASLAHDVDAMLKMGWKVRAECDTCGVQLRVDLVKVIAGIGRQGLLWGATTRCKNLKCATGVMRFWGCPPYSRDWNELTAEWAQRKLELAAEREREMEKPPPPSPHPIVRL